MLTVSSDGNNAIVTTLGSVRPHPNADRVQLATVLGEQVVVGLDMADGDVVIYFSSNLRLSPEYLSQNNLYSNSELNVDTSAKGYFGKNGRVRAQRFRGEMSNGYVADIQSIQRTVASVNGPSTMEYFQVGDEFTHVEGVKICEKYVIPHRTPGAPGSRKKRVKEPVSEMFWKHWDTKHLLRESHRIPAGVVYIEEKIHGTSARTGKVLFKTERPWWKFWAPTVSEEWKVVSGTRRVDHIGAHIPGVRKEIEEKLAPHLRKGEQVYYEVFGHSKTGAEIQSGFSYGCKACEYRVILYRATITTPDGHCVDLSREAVYRRADELGMERPPLLWKVYYTGSDFGEASGWCTFEDLKDRLACGKSVLDANTIREGVVVWFEDDHGNWSALKLKSDEYLLKEDKQREKGIGDVEDDQ